MQKRLTLAAITLLCGCSLLSKSPQEVNTRHYTCGTMPLTVQMNNAQQQVSFIMDGKSLTLKQEVSASGTRYSDGTYDFWSTGTTASIARNNKIIVNDCQQQPDR